MENIKALVVGIVVLALLTLTLYTLPAVALSFVSSVFGVLILIGMGFGLLDHYYWWQQTYRFLYNLCTWGDPMPTHEVDGTPLVRGVFLEQPTSTKLTRAGIIAFLAFFYTVYELKFGVSFLLQILLGFLDVPAVMMGVVLGNLTYTHLLSRHKKLADQIDSIGDHMQNFSVSGVANRMPSPLAWLKSRVWPEVPPPAPPATSIDEPLPVEEVLPQDEPEPPQETAQQRLDKLLKRRH